MRVLLTELTRLNSHLVWLGTHAMDIGALTVFLYCFREREQILRLFDDVSGQRMMSSYFRIGGLALEPPLDFFHRVQRLAQDDAGKDRRVRKPAHRQSNLDQSSVRESAISAPPMPLPWESPDRLCAPAASIGICAATCPIPATRSSSSRCPSPTVGDVWTRYTLRVQEMRESVKICQQALDGMPEGPIKADAPKVVLPDREKMKTADGSPHLSL